MLLYSKLSHKADVVNKENKGKFGIFDAYESAHQHGGDYGDLAGRCNQR